MNADPDQIREALAYVSPDDHVTWIHMGAAVKAALGDAGLDIWFDWSLGTRKFRERDALRAWRSLPVRHDRTAGTLFNVAKARGWRPKSVSNVVALRQERPQTHQEPRSNAEHAAAKPAAPSAPERTP